MKNILKIEEFGLLALFTSAYFHFYPGEWGLYLGLFFVPDISFALYAVSTKAGAFAYNILHHKGVMAALMLAGLFLMDDLLIKMGMIFMAHSCFDRILGYGLKYQDSFAHTHLGWIGKHASLNKE
jgi:hypothetical protein